MNVMSPEPTNASADAQRPAEATAAVIGGFGSLPGALLGGLIIGIVEPLAQYYGAPGYSQIAPYAIMLLVLVLRPNGLFAQVHQKKV